MAELIQSPSTRSGQFEDSFHQWNENLAWFYLFDIVWYPKEGLESAHDWEYHPRHYYEGKGNF